MIKAVIFDFDDTLGDRNGYAYLYYQDTLEKCFPDACKDSLLKEAMLQDIMMWEEKGQTLKDYPFIKLCKKYHLEYPDFDFKQDFKNRIGDFSYLYEDSLKVINELKKKYKVALLTNGDAKGQRKKISNAIDLDVFDVVIISGETPYDKPAKEIYDLVVRELDCKPSEAVMIGDNFANDIYGAIKAGLDAICFETDNCRCDNYQIKRISRLSDLLNIL